MLLAPWSDAALAGILGLLVGSFLNVVIYRIPKMMERQLAAEGGLQQQSVCGCGLLAFELGDKPLDQIFSDEVRGVTVHEFAPVLVVTFRTC